MCVCMCVCVCGVYVVCVCVVCIFTCVSLCILLILLYCIFDLRYGCCTVKLIINNRIIIIIIPLCRDLANYVSETNHVSRVHGVAAIL